MSNKFDNNYFLVIIKIILLIYNNQSKTKYIGKIFRMY